MGLVLLAVRFRQAVPVVSDKVAAEVCSVPPLEIPLVTGSHIS